MVNLPTQKIAQLSEQIKAINTAQADILETKIAFIRTYIFDELNKDTTMVASLNSIFEETAKLNITFKNINHFWSEAAEFEAELKSDGTFVFDYSCNSGGRQKEATTLATLDCLSNAIANVNRLMIDMSNNPDPYKEFFSEYTEINSKRERIYSEIKALKKSYYNELNDEINEIMPPIDENEIAKIVKDITNKEKIKLNQNWVRQPFVKLHLHDGGDRVGFSNPFITAEVTTNGAILFRHNGERCKKSDLPKLLEGAIKFNGNLIESISELPFTEQDYAKGVVGKEVAIEAMVRRNIQQIENTLCD